MDDLTLARALHVLAVLLWIGGVGFVTTVVMPAIVDSNGAVERLAAFHRIEGRFASQARLWVLLAASLIALAGAVAGSHGLDLFSFG